MPEALRKAVIHTDGASSGNPGPAGIGVHIAFEGRIIEIAAHIGTATNNVAEYSALITGLREARELGADEVQVFMDSELAVKQVNGQYKVKNEGIKPLFAEATSLLRSFKKRSVRHVPREKNTFADKLSKVGTKPATGTKRTELMKDGSPASSKPLETKAENTETHPGMAGSKGQGSLPF